MGLGAGVALTLVWGSLACAPAGSLDTPGSNTVWGEPAADADPTPAPPPVVLEPEAPPKPTFPDEIVEAAKKISEGAKGKTRAWDRLAYMVDMYGPRLSGSKALEQSIDYTIETMKADGLDNVRREEVMVPHWERGKESVRVISPRIREMPMLGLGGSVGTKGALKAEVAVVTSLEQISERGDDLKGKIVVINRAMPEFDHANKDAHYGETVQIRSRGAVEAAKVGAKAVLIRSVTAQSLRTPHTGAMHYEEGVKKIPAAAIPPADAEFFERMQKRGEPVKVELKMSARTFKDAKSGNAIGEILGREKPDEIVVIGGHIDSWDVGDGAHDDGSGCLMALEALTLIKEAGLQPKRTIRAVMFTNEENGLRGGKAYFEAHGKEKHVAAMEADIGSGEPQGIGVAGNDEQVAALAKYLPLFSDIGLLEINHGWGGADISPLTKDGVLSLSVRPDYSHYFDMHHSPADTVDKINPDHLERNAAAMALMAFILAERD
jgi:Zn-dependent M28 family amino/carboxypeptidase